MWELITRVESFIYLFPWNQTGIALAIILLFWLIRNLFTRYVFKTLLNLAKKTQTDLDTNILLAFEKPVRYFFVFLGLYLASLYLPLDAGVDFFMLNLFRSSIIALLAWGFYELTSHSFLLQEIYKKMKVELDQILIPFLSKIVRFIIVILALTIIAQEWGYDVNGFIAGLGIGGLAVALAAKDAIANVFGGVMIITDKPFSIGDWVLTPSVEGTVEDISFRSTRIRTFANALVTVPNSVLANQPITNWTRMGKRRVTFNLGVTYTTPRAKLEKCVHEIRNMLSNHPEVHKDIIFAAFDQFGSSSLDIFIYFFTITTKWGDYIKVKEELNFKIMEILENEGVSVAFPSQSVYMETPLHLNKQAPDEKNI